jgi:hypothetical protein
MLDNTDIKTVLVILNNDDYANHLSRQVGEMGHESSRARTISEAIEQTKTNDFYAVVFCKSLPEGANAGLKYALELMESGTRLGFYSPHKNVPPKYEDLMDNCVMIDPMKPVEGLQVLLQ